MTLMTSIGFQLKNSLIWITWNSLQNTILLINLGLHKKNVLLQAVYAAVKSEYENGDSAKRYSSILWW